MQHKKHLAYAFLGESSGNKLRDKIIPTGFGRYGIFKVDEEKVDSFYQKMKTLKPAEIQIIFLCEYLYVKQEGNFYTYIQKIAELFPNSLIYVFVANEKDADQYGTISGLYENVEVVQIKLIGKLTNKTYVEPKLMHYFNLDEDQVNEIRQYMKRNPYLTEEVGEAVSDKKVSEKEEPLARDSKKIDEEEFVKKHLYESEEPAGSEYVKWTAKIKNRYIPIQDKRLLKEKVKQKVNNQLTNLPIKTTSKDIIEPKRIAVMNLYPSCGSTFIVNNLAIHLAKNFNIRPGVLEVLQEYPELFFYLKKNKPRNWTCWYDQVRKGEGLTKDNIWETHGVYWIPQDPHALHNIAAEDFDYSHALEVYYSASNLPILLIDCSSNIMIEGGFTQEVILDHVDEVWVVFDSRIYKVEYAKSMLEQVKSKISNQTSLKFILNNTPENFNQKILENFLEQEFITIIPHHPSLLELGYSKHFPILDVEGRELLTPYFHPLLKRVVKDTVLQEHQDNPKKDSFFQMLFN